MTPALAELVRRSCLCSDGMCAACTQIVAALEQGERLRAAAQTMYSAAEFRADGSATVDTEALKRGWTAYRAALHGQEAADAE